MNYIKFKIIILSFLFVLFVLFLFKFNDDIGKEENNKNMTNIVAPKYNVKLEEGFKEKEKIRELDNLLESVEKELFALEKSNKNISLNKLEKQENLFKLKNEIEKVKNDIVKLNTNKN